MKMKIVANKTASRNYNSIDEWLTVIKDECKRLNYDLEKDTKYRYYLSPKRSISTEELTVLVFISKHDDIYVPSCIVEMSDLNSHDFPADESIEKILTHWHEVGKLITQILSSRIYA
jgi:hypothetical protein